MKKLLMIAALAACTPFCISAATPPETVDEAQTMKLTDMPDWQILQIMEQMDNQTLGRIAKTSTRLRQLALPELARREEKLAMLKQREEFKQHIKENRLFLTKKDITHIYSGVFDDPAFSKIQTIYLHHNKLSTIPAGAFNNLPQLQTIVLYRNPLTPEEIESLRKRFSVKLMFFSRFA